MAQVGSKFACTPSLKTMSGQQKQLQRYLTLVPRGLEDVASSVIREALIGGNGRGGASSCTYVCHNLQILSPRHETDEYKQGMLDKLKKQQAKKLAKEMRRKKWMNHDAADAASNHAGTEEGNGTVNGNDDSADHSQPTVGTIQTTAGDHISFGHRDGQSVMCKPGPFEGLIPLTFETDAPPIVVAGLRGMGCGPLLALVASSHLETSSSSGSSSPVSASASASASAGVFGYEQNAQEALASAAAFVGATGGSSTADDAQIRADYLSQFRRALSVWFDHAESVWFANNGDFYGVDMADPTNRAKGDSLRAKRNGDEPLSFRMSCTRTYSKKYKHWKREDVMAPLADLIVPSDELQMGKDPWKVDMKKHDFEVLVVIHDTALTIGIVLRPYQVIGSKTYSNGTLPPDILPPFIKGDTGSEVVRLRPSTAALLLNLAKVQPGDVVLDPCGGLGTLPVEAALGSVPCVGLGGDVALRNANFTSMAKKYLKGVKKITSSKSSAGSGAANFTAWDAALLPIRDGSVDCIVSDLPFGSKCLSSSKLQRFLPLLISECARILHPGSGRIVFLCGAGSYQNIIDIIESQKSTLGTPSFRSPRAVFPVNIGGFIAWVVIVERGEDEHLRGADHLDKVRKIASISKQQEKDIERKSAIRKQMGGEFTGRKFRRLQS